MNKEKVYSYHTFYFPFVWSYGKKSLSLDKYSKALEKKNWTDVSLKSVKEGSEKGLDSNLRYQTLQYFTESARESIFGWGDRNFVKYYAYNQDIVHDKAKYHIEKQAKDGFFVYDLSVHAIKLKLFNTGIGIVIFETQNNDYRTLDDVKRINEYGRRVFSLFPEKKGGTICADVLGIIYADGRTDTDNLFEKVSDKLNLPETDSENVPQFIRNILPDTVIKPAIDDRMFVACLVNASPRDMKQIKNYEENEKCSKSLYELIYIDAPGRCTCPTKAMRDELLSESIYKRWEDSGNIWGISHQALVAVTTAAEEYAVEIPFLIQYSHIVSLVLAQRASIIAFDTTSSRLSAEFEKKGKALNSSKINELIELQEKYVAFLNQHNNIEITCQDQGKELYQLLQREMYVERNNERLSREIDILTSAANTANDNKINRIAILVTIAIVFAQPLVDRCIEKIISLVQCLFVK